MFGGCVDYNRITRGFFDARWCSQFSVGGGGGIWSPTVGAHSRISSPPSASASAARSSGQHRRAAARGPRCCRARRSSRLSSRCLGIIWLFDFVFHVAQGPPSCLQRQPLIFSRCRARKGLFFFSRSPMVLLLDFCGGRSAESRYFFNCCSRRHCQSIYGRDQLFVRRREV